MEKKKVGRKPLYPYAEGFVHVARLKELRGLSHEEAQEIVRANRYKEYMEETKPSNPRARKVKPDKPLSRRRQQMEESIERAKAKMITALEKKPKPEPKEKPIRDGHLPLPRTLNNVSKELAEKLLLMSEQGQLYVSAYHTIAMPKK